MMSADLVEKWKSMGMLYNIEEKQDMHLAAILLENQLQDLQRIMTQFPDVARKHYKTLSYMLIPVGRLIISDLICLKSINMMALKKPYVSLDDCTLITSLSDYEHVIPFELLEMDDSSGVEITTKLSNEIRREIVEQNAHATNNGLYYTFCPYILAYVKDMNEKEIKISFRYATIMSEEPIKG